MTTARTPCFLAFLCCTSLFAATYEPSAIKPPKPVREFRGVWVATVANIDWPSKPGLPVKQQKSELLAILDRAAGLKLNAVIFQVRPASDAMYMSSLEPWSEYLTGTMGQAPLPFYDPLAFAIEEAHKRGLELHAWFNPYRASHPSEKSTVATKHIVRSRPDLVRHYGSYLWLDPGEPDVQDHILRVVMDVVRRYDVDGVQFDDYFYPYPVKGAGGKNIGFPDDASWKKYGVGGALSRDDWRRENVNTLIQRAHNSIKAAKPWVKFGISPIGIWRPGSPPQIQGSDNYSLIYADSRKWLVNGWVDYFSPQLYWPIAQKAQSFPVLLDWWDMQNPKQRNIWPGLFSYKVLEGWPPEEIVKEIGFAARQPVSAGHIHYNMKALMVSAELRAALKRGPYAEAALIPASPWMGRTVTNKPDLFLSGQKSGNLRLAFRPAPGEQVSRWVLQTKTEGRWLTEFLPGGTQARFFGNIQPELIALTPIDRYGNAGLPAVLERKEK
jgi:uncharacterized lipoprotein YddW (UPF0748 family)